MTRGEKAKALFEKGYNCCQAVTLSFSDVLGLEEKTLAALASGFGGGMGRMREVCGAVSGMFIVADLLCGYTSPTDDESKKKTFSGYLKECWDEAMKDTDKNLKTAEKPARKK